MLRTLLLVYWGLQLSVAISPSQPRTRFHSHSPSSPRQIHSTPVSPQNPLSSYNSTSSRPRKTNLTHQALSNIAANLPQSRKSRNPALINPPSLTTTSNPKNDVEVIGPIATPPPQAAQPPAFPPPLPDYPPLLYPYEPPSYYPLDDPNDAGLFPPFYGDLPSPATTLPPLPETTTTRYTEPVTRYTEPTTPRTPRPTTAATQPTKFTTKPSTKFTFKPYTLKPFSVPKVTLKRISFYHPPTTPSYWKTPVTISPVTENKGLYHPEPVTDNQGFYNPWTTKRPPAPPPIWPSLTRTTDQSHPYAIQDADLEVNFPHDGYWPYHAVQIRAELPPDVETVSTAEPVDHKYMAILSNYEKFNETAGTFGFDIDLENGLTVQVRGYKKDGKQIIDGSFLLYTNQGEPVRITYVADDDDNDSLNKKSTTTRVPIPREIDIENFTNTQMGETTTVFWKS